MQDQSKSNPIRGAWETQCGVGSGRHMKLELDITYVNGSVECGGRSDNSMNGLLLNEVGLTAAIAVAVAVTDIRFDGSFKRAEQILQPLRDPLNIGFWVISEQTLDKINVPRLKLSLLAQGVKLQRILLQARCLRVLDSRDTGRRVAY
jgi:hypothetical protein